jgi:hypothetical protein
VSDEDIRAMAEAYTVDLEAEPELPPIEAGAAV